MRDMYFSCRLLLSPGFQTANVYLLAGQESRFLADTLPTYGPTLTGTHFPDLDRHASGLSCFRQDHVRFLVQSDPDLKERRRQDREDVLSDSESDDENPTPLPKPTMERVRQILTQVVPEEQVPAKGQPAVKGKG